MSVRHAGHGAAPPASGRRAPLRIAMIVGGFPKLSEPFILDQITGLLDLGHDVHVYARREPREPAVHPEVAEYGLAARTHVFDLPAGRGARLARVAAVWARHGLRHPRALLRCASPSRHGSLYAVLNNLMHVPPFLARPYDVVFCQFGGNGIDFAFLKDLFPRTRLVTMFHGNDFSLGDEGGPRVFERLRAMGDLFLVNTDHYGGSKLRAEGFDPRRIATFHLPVKRGIFRERALRPDGLHILSVGRLVRKKGLEFGIRAVARLQDANPHLRIEYRIIGEGTQREPLTALIGELGRAESIQLLGALPRGAVMQAMYAADLFLLPSLMEQAGMVLGEAQASGMPVVASRVGGVPEMVLEGRSALLVPPADPEAIAAGLQRLLDHPEQWAAMGRAGRRHVETEHDHAIQARRLAALLAPAPAAEAAG